MGDRIVVMEKGKIQQVAGPLDLYDHPNNRFVAGFIGTPPMNFVDGTLERVGEGLVFRSAGVELPLPAAWSGKLSAHAGKAVTFGIRPEDLGSSTAERKPDAPRLKAQVDVTEPMGSETYVYLKAGAHALVSRVDAHRVFTEGQTTELAVAIDRAHLFDKDGATLV